MKSEENLIERMQSASRLREIRENADLTQEQFSEILGISLSAYKKVESGENNVSLSCVKKLYEELGVSADYVLFGEKVSFEKTWESVLNCSETDKMFLLLRLLAYFTDVKKGIFPLKEGQSDFDKKVLDMIDKLQGYGED